MLYWRVFSPGGVMQADFPGATTGNSITRIIGQGEPVSIQIPMDDRLDDDWRRWTDPHMYVWALIDDQTFQVWYAGLITAREFSHEPVIRLKIDCMESEDGWLNRNFPQTDVRYTGWNQLIMAAEIGGLTRMVNTQFYGSVIMGSTSIVRDREYLLADNITHREILYRLMRIRSGIEFTVDWTFNASSGRLECHPTLAMQLGRPIPLDGPPTVTFTATEWKMEESFSRGNGANRVVAYASREGDIQVRATASYTNNKLNSEIRYSPDTGSVNATVLQQYADARVLATAYGLTTISAQVLAEDIRWGTDVQLGDWVNLELNNEMNPSLNQTVMVRLVGYTILADLRNVKLILMEAE